MSEAAHAAARETDHAAAEAAIDEAIAACEGDPRAAVGQLLEANGILEREIRRLAARVSSGYSRGRVTTLQ